MLVVSLYGARSCVPDLDCLIFGARDHPFALTMECNPRNVIVVPFESHNRIRVGGLDIVESNDMATGSSEKFLVRRNTEAVHLRFRMLNRARADTRESLPETYQ